MIAPPPTAASTNQPNIDQIAANSVTASSDSSGSAPPPRESGWRLCQTRSAIASATPSPITAIANQPKSGRMAAKSARARTSSRLPPCLPEHKGRDRAAHRGGRNDERRGENQPCKRRVASHVRGNRLTGLGPASRNSCWKSARAGRTNVERVGSSKSTSGQLHEPLTGLSIRSGGSHVCISGKSSRAIRLHARSTRSPSGVG